MRRGAWFVGLVAAIATCTWMVAWWMVPVVGAIWGWVRREDAATPLLAGLAGALGWAVLLLISASGAPEGSVMTSVGRAMQVGSGALVVLTLAFAALLAAGAAGVVRAVRPAPHAPPGAANDG